MLEGGLPDCEAHSVVLIFNAFQSLFLCLLELSLYLALWAHTPHVQDQ